MCQSWRAAVSFSLGNNKTVFKFPSLDKLKLPTEIISLKFPPKQMPLFWSKVTPGLQWSPARSPRVSAPQFVLYRRPAFRLALYKHSKYTGCLLARSCVLGLSTHLFSFWGGGIEFQFRTSLGVASTASGFEVVSPALSPALGSGAAPGAGRDPRTLSYFSQHPTPFLKAESCTSQRHADRRGNGENSPCDCSSSETPGNSDTANLKLQTSLF